MRISMRAVGPMLGTLGIAKNTLVYLAGTAVGRFAILVMTLVLAHSLGPVDFGRYGFIIAYLAIFRLVGNLGLTPVLAREFARTSVADVKRTFRTALTLKVAMGLVAVVAAAVVIVVGSDDPVLTTAAIVASLSLVGVISELFAAYFQARERLPLVIAAEATQYVVTGVLAVVLVLSGGGVLAVCVAILAGNLAQLALLVVAAHRELELRVGFDSVLARRLLREAMPLAAMAAFGVINLRIDVVLLFAMRTEEEVGLYTAAVRIAEIVVLASIAFTASVFPRLARLYATDPPAFVRVQAAGAKYLIAAVLPVSVAGAILARDVILFVYGDAYAASALPFAILIVAELFLFLEIFNTYVLIASGRERFAAAFTIVAGLVNVGANLVLITQWGIGGAALASLISYSSYFVLQSFFSSTRPLTVSAIALSTRAIVAALVMGLVVASLEPRSPAIAILAGPVVYSLVLLGLRGIDLGELRMLFGQRVAEIT